MIITSMCIKKLEKYVRSKRAQWGDDKRNKVERKTEKKVMRESMKKSKQKRKKMGDKIK